jgi:DNA-binding NarL/FixJ family response regulator
MRVVIGEDEALLRDGLTLVLEQGGFDVVGVAAAAQDLVRQARQLRPELVVADIRMPPGFGDDGLRAALEIRQTLPAAAIVVLSQHLQRRYVHELLADRPAAIGYLLKQRIGDIPTFCADLERVCAGGTVLDPEAVALMVTRARKDHDGLQRMTGRQLEVLALMAAGRSNAAIARSLSISEKAVAQHASHIYDELELTPSDDDNRRVLAVIRYLER